MIALHAPSLRAAWGALLVATLRRVTWLWPPARRRAMAARQAQWERLLAELRGDDAPSGDDAGPWMDANGFHVTADVSDEMTEAEEVELAALIRAVHASEQMQALRHRVCEMADVDTVAITLAIEGLDSGYGDGVD